MDDYSQNIFTTGRVGFGVAQRGSGVLEVRGDVDWLKISLTAGKTYTFELSGALIFNSENEMLNLYSDTGRVLASKFDTSFLDGPLITYTALTTADYYLEVRDLFGEGTGSYVIEANEIISTNDLIKGTSGPDVFQGGAGSDRIEGGAGVDTSKYTGSLIDYSIQRLSNGERTVSDKIANRDGIDTLNSIERLIFRDKGLAFDTDGPTSAGGIYRLYKATFDRAPDHGGLGYWIDKADEGRSAVSMAEDFVWSQEFQKLYGVTTRDQYLAGSNISDLVSGMYRNVLDRSPDAGGLNYYVGVINSKEKTVGRVLAEISDSPENYAATIGVIQNGIQYDVWLG